MNGLARASLRARHSLFAGVFVALFFVAAVVTACATMAATAGNATTSPQRYADASVVVAADQKLNGAPLPDLARLDASLAKKLPGEVIADTLFPVHANGFGELDGQPMSALTLLDRTVDGAAAGPGQVVLGRASDASIGDRVELTTAAGTATYEVSGLVDGSGAWFPDDEVGALSGHPGKVDAFAVMGASADEVRNAIGDGPRVLTGDDRAQIERPDLVQAKVELTDMGGAFVSITSYVGIFLIGSVVAMALAQRQQEVALLRAIGAKPWQIRRMVVAETTLVALVAAGVGGWSGRLLASWWLSGMKDRGLIPTEVALSTSWVPWAASAGGCVGVAVLGSLLGARRASRTRPSQALRDAAVPRRGIGPIRAVLGISALGGGVALATLAMQEAGSEALDLAPGVIMTFMVAAALLGPVLAWVFAGVLGLVARIVGVSGELAGQNGRALSARLASAITPVVLVVCFVIVQLGMTQTTTHMGSEQIRESTTADLVVDVPGGATPALIDAARNADGVDTAVGILDTSAFTSAYGGTQITARGYTGSASDLATVLDPKLRSGELSDKGIAMSRPAAMMADVEVGDTTKLRLADGTPVDVRVTAIFTNSFGVADVLLPASMVAGHVTDALPGSVLVSASDIAGARAALHDIAPDASVRSAADFAALQDEYAEEQQWLNYVGVGILVGLAAIAAANTLVVVTIGRRRELALLRLVGASARQVRTMVRVEALMVAVSALVMGIAISLITMVPLLRVITGKAMPYFPWGMYVGVLAAPTLLVLVATAVPLRRLLRSRAFDDLATA